MSTTATFDDALLSDAFFQDPHSIYHKMRQAAPVYWSEAWGAWVLTRYEDVMATLHDPKQFSSAGRVKYLLRQLPPETRAQIDLLERHYDTGLAHTDPPDHTRMRGLLNKVFTPRMVEARRERIAEVVNGLLDAVQEGGQMDIIEDLAYPLPATIIAEMIGAPPEDIGLFQQWALDINRLFERGGRIADEAAREAQNSLLVMRDYISRLMEERRKNPQDDILGRLAAAKDEADKLTLQELVSTVVTFFVAGHETTTNLIANGMLALLQHPEQMQKLRANPALMPGALEEMLRYEPSVPRGWRIATEPMEIGGQAVQEGAMIFPILSAANRDPEIFPQPDSFDIERKNNRHLAFGYGIHFCLGAPLARLEGAVAIDLLLRRLPQMQLDTRQPIVWRHDVAIRRAQALHVRF